MPQQVSNGRSTVRSRVHSKKVLARGSTRESSVAPRYGGPVIPSRCLLPGDGTLTILTEPTLGFRFAVREEEWP